jgi:hypothetical protein
MGIPRIVGLYKGEIGEKLKAILFCNEGCRERFFNNFSVFFGFDLSLPYTVIKKILFFFL